MLQVEPQSTWHDITIGFSRLSNRSCKSTNHYVPLGDI